METERNLLDEVGVKLFAVHRKDASMRYLKNYKFGEVGFQMVE